MSQNKTQPTGQSAEAFLNTVDNDKRRQDAFEVLQMMQEITGKDPVMWGDSIIGFDQYHYTYDSGREGDFLIVGFSPRKTALTLYLSSGFARYDELMSKLGKYKTGKSCLYIKKLEDVNREVLTELISQSVQYMRKKYH
jgi:hypothetical protein